MGVIPEHDLTATLTENGTLDTMEVTLTYIPPPNFYSDTYPYWEFEGDTFPVPGAPEISSDLIQMVCLAGEMSIGLVYDGINGETPLVSQGPFHADFSGLYINPFTRYSSIVIDDPTP